MLLDYALDRFKLSIPAGNPYRHAIDGEIERTPYQTLTDSDGNVKLGRNLLVILMIGLVINIKLVVCFRISIMLLLMMVLG